MTMRRPEIEAAEHVFHFMYEPELPEAPDGMLLLLMIQVRGNAPVLILHTAVNR